MYMYMYMYIYIYIYIYILLFKPKQPSLCMPHTRVAARYSTLYEAVNSKLLESTSFQPV